MKRFFQMLPLLALASAGQAGTILDQSNVADLGSGSLNDSFEWQQQAIDGIGGVLAGVELFTFSGSDSVVVSIGLGSAFFSGPFAFTTTATIGSGGTFIDTSAADIILTPGEQFVIDVSGGTGDVANLSALNTLYAGGDLFRNIDGNIVDVDALGGQFSNVSLAFETFVESSSSPEPGTLGLFCGGLAGLIWIQRRRA